MTQEEGEGGGEPTPRVTFSSGEDREGKATLNPETAQSGVAAALVRPSELRLAMRQFATGVAIITTRSSSGEPAGFTANSLTSVSLDPPLVLLCMGRQASSHAAIQESGRFSVSILGNHQAELARRFASESPDARFRDFAFREGLGEVPLVEGALAWLECRLWKVTEAGDHWVIFGEVEGAGVRPDLEGAARPDPLVYHGGAFGTLAR
jgi:flavin reductase (DIM6/NTAB) family NADH-FMN oxidoreductase RutF